MLKYLKYMFMAAIVSVAATGCQEDAEDAFSTDPTAPELVNNGKILMTQNTMSEDITWAWTAARFFEGNVSYTVYMQYGEESPVAVGTSAGQSLTVSKESFRSQLAGLSYLPKNDSYSVNFYVNASDGISSVDSEKQSVTIYAYGDAVSAVATALVPEIVLDVNDPMGEIKLLEWEAARLNYNEAITYDVTISYDGGEPKSVATGLTTTSCSTTVDGLNELAVAAGAPEAAASDLDLTVIAYSDSYPAGVPSAPVKMNITTYVATYPDCYYLPGSYQGWNPATAKTLPQSSTQKGLFEGFVDLTTEDGSDVQFKFSPVPAWEGDFGSDDFAVSTDKGFAVGSGNSVGSANIQVPSGFYRISLNKKLNKLEMQQVLTLGIIGEAVPSGWGAETKMAYDAATNSFSAVTTLTEGKEFKFRLNDDWDYSIGEGGDFSGGNYKMDMPTGEYKVVLSVASHPYKLQIISTAFPTEEFIYVPGNHQGWNPATAAALKTAKFDGIYTGYGYMDGQFKFTKQRNWDAEYNTGNFSTYNGAVEGGAQPKDNMNCTQAGFYQIVANVMDATLTFTETSWGIIGPAQPGGWNDDTNMTYNKEEDCWEVTVELAADELKFRANDAWDINVGGSFDDLSEGAGNIKVAEAGTYEVKLYLSRTTTDKMYCTLTKK